MDVNHGTYRATCAQVLATLAFNCLMVNLGIITAMPVIVIGALRLKDSPLTFTNEQASWFGGLIFVIQPLGSLVSGFLQDPLGRKTCMLLVNIPQVVAWLMIFYATSVFTLFAAMTLFGLSIGFMEAPVLSYIGEISEPRLRGVLSSFGCIFFNVGLVIESSLGAVTDWRTMVLISAVTPVFAFLAIFVVPDSPAWLVSRDRVEDAQKALQWLRGWVPAEAVQDDLDALANYVKDNHNNHVVANNEGDLSNLVRQVPSESKLKIFLHSSVQRPLRLIVLYFFITSSTSLCAMKPYFIEILGDLDVTIDPHQFNVICTTLTLLGSLTSTLTMRRVGKRGLTFLSLGMSTICCMSLGIYLCLGLHIPWMPVLLFSVSYYSATLGSISIPWILISELFPFKGRGIAGGVSAAFGYFIMFVFIKTYYNVVSLIKMYGACFLYGTVGMLGLAYLYFQLPETEGVQLEVIELIFAESKSPPRNLPDEENVIEARSKQQ